MILIVRSVFDDGDGYEVYRIEDTDYESACLAVDKAKELYDDNAFHDEWKGFYDYVETEFNKRNIGFHRETYGLASVDMI